MPTWHAGSFVYEGFIERTTISKNNQIGQRKNKRSD